MKCTQSEPSVKSCFLYQKQLLSALSEKKIHGGMPLKEKQKSAHVA